MSTQRGNDKKKGPKYQNSFAFKHNAKSKKTAHILSLPIKGLCTRCHDQIEWRKKYRKYKPLTKPATCSQCHQKNVHAAYHTICDSCAKLKDICAKCCQKKDIVISEHETNANLMKEQIDFQENLNCMKERDRRSYLRKLEREKREFKKDISSTSHDHMNISDGYESYEDMEEDDYPDIV